MQRQACFFSFSRFHPQASDDNVLRAGPRRGQPAPLARGESQKNRHALKRCGSSTRAARQIIDLGSSQVDLRKLAPSGRSNSAQVLTILPPRFADGCSSRARRA